MYDSQWWTHSVAPAGWSCWQLAHRSCACGVHMCWKCEPPVPPGSPETAPRTGTWSLLWPADPIRKATDIVTTDLLLHWHCHYWPLIALTLSLLTSYCLWLELCMKTKEASKQQIRSRRCLVCILSWRLERKVKTIAWNMVLSAVNFQSCSLHDLLKNLNGYTPHMCTGTIMPLPVTSSNKISSNFPTHATQNKSQPSSLKQVSSLTWKWNQDMALTNKPANPCQTSEQTSSLQLHLSPCHAEKQTKQEQNHF